MTRIFIYLCVLSMMISWSAARTLKAIFIQAPASAPDKAFLYNGELSLELTLPGRNLSDEVVLPKGDLEFVVLAEAPVEGQELAKNAKKIVIPKDWKQTILVFVPVKRKNGFPANVIAFNASEGQFLNGQTKIYNLTSSIFLGVVPTPGRKVPRVWGVLDRSVKEE